MNIISLMSGTSLDGLDIAFTSITEGGRRFELLAAETVPYPEEWVSRLSNLERASALEYALADVELGHYFGKCINAFRERHPGEVDLVASHGHTIFHQPEKGLTTQIGQGPAIAAETSLPVAYDFRTLDVALGGQGAPLVPIGDELLFVAYGACLNLGGFSNISFNHTADPERRTAFDVSPCNMALNHLARLMGAPFDKGGAMAASGKVNGELLAVLNGLDYYHRQPPKSLGKEWFVSQFLPLVSSVPPVEAIATVTEHVAYQISRALPERHTGKSVLLVTGGGARNGYLLSRLQHYASGWDIEVPSEQILEYKEAIIFALLGYLRYEGKPNCLQSVTGARYGSVGGAICNPLPK